jgi:undecaprenyl-diphosphatase
METTAFHAINDLAGHIDQVDDVFEFLASKGPLLLVLVAIAMWFWPGPQADRDLRQWGCLVAGGAGALALGVNQILIRLWDRPRPFAEIHTVLLLKPSADPSFPSDHATFAFAVATATLLANRRLGLIAMWMAAVLSFARVYVGEHYVSDVLAGAAIGSVVAAAVFSLRPVVWPLLASPMRLARRLHLA